MQLYYFYSNELSIDITSLFELSSYRLNNNSAVEKLTRNVIQKFFRAQTLSARLIGHRSFG